MSKNDEPITRVTSLEFTPDPNSTFNGLYPPQLTTQEIDALPTTTDRIGCIIFNEQSQELQTLSAAQQWVNISTDNSEPIFSSVTVIDNIVSTSGVVIGTRPGTAFYTSVAIPVDLNTTPVKIPNQTVLTHLNTGFNTGGFLNRIEYAQGADYPSTINVFVNAVINIASITTIGTYFAYLYKNGSQVSSSDGVCQIGAVPGAPVILALSSYQALNNNDYLELWMSCSTASTGVIVNCNMNVTQI